MPIHLPPFPNGGLPAPKFLDTGNSDVADSGSQSWASPTPIGPPLFSRPIKSLETPYILEQEFCVLINNLNPLPFNTPHPNSAYSNYVLVGEGPASDMGNGVCKWTRTYLAVPASYSEWEQFTYTFPGVTSPDGAVTRLPLTQRVQSRVQNDFFLVDPSLSGNKPGASPYPLYFDPGQIPILQPFKVINQFKGTGQFSNMTFGGWWNQLTTTSVAGASTPSIPTSQVYIGIMMIDAVTNGWGPAGTVTNMVVNSDFNNQVYGIPNPILNYTPPAGGQPPGTVFGGQIPTDPSTLTRFMANVWLRQTRYVLAI